MGESNSNSGKPNNTSQKKKVRSAAAMERRAAKWATQKAAKKASALATRNAEKAEKEAKEKRVLEMFPNIMGIVGAQGFMPNMRKSQMTSKTMRNALKSTPLFQNANRGTIYPGGKTMLGHFLENGNWAKAMEVLDKGVPKRILDAPTALGHVPLLFAYDANQLPLFKKLLEKGADPNIMLSNDKTQYPILSQIIFSWRSHADKITFIDELLKHKANINKLSSEQKTPLDYAIQRGLATNDNHVAFHLIDKGAFLEAPNQSGFTAVLSAITSSNRKVLEYMVTKKSVDLDKKTGKNGLFPLKLAVLNGSYDILNDLFAYGIKDVNQKDTEGNTALHYAVLTKAFMKIALLKEKGAKANISNKKGVTPLQLAQALDTAGNSRAYDILKE